uniref:CUB domain containing protein 1a n=1 Tax=Oryzias latipes TaxID=8090 RepID=A0A3P9I595_ORYLA
MFLRTAFLLPMLLFLTTLESSGCFQTVVQPSKGSTVTVSTTLPLAQCAVCTVSGDNLTSCHSILSLVPEAEVKLLFNCSQPLDQSFTVTVNHSIDCTDKSCQPQTIGVQSSILTKFPRTFNWEVTAPEETVVTLDILGEGLKETSQPCSGGLEYSVAASKTNNKGLTRYCQAGDVTRLNLLDQNLVSIHVKPETVVESLLFQASAGPLEGPKMDITVGPSSTVVLMNNQKLGSCKVCTQEGPLPHCTSPGQTLTSGKQVTVEFRCLRPQDVISVTMMTKMDCTQTSCNPAAAEVDPNFFKDFNRTLTWDVSVPERTVLNVSFPIGGVKEISQGETCQDGYQYTVSLTKRDGDIQTSSYCKGGSVTQLDFLGATTLMVEAPGGAELDGNVFSVTTRPRGSRIMPVQLEQDVVVTIHRNAAEPECSVCVGKAPEQTCDPQYQRLTYSPDMSVEFTCPNPQEIFKMDINREIDCTATGCPGNSVQTKDIFPDFNRTFTWDLKVLASQTFQLDFPEPGMRQIPEEETCPDSHTYSLKAYPRSGVTSLGSFCKGGPVTTMQVRFKGRVALQVPGGVKADPVVFKVSVGPQTKMIAMAKVELPRGVTDTSFFSADYRRQFPDDQQMQWNFSVPAMHNYSVLLLDHTAPECIQDTVVVQYQKENGKTLRLSLTDPQPQHQQGNFEMVLKNCQTNTSLPGLTFSYKVSVTRSGHPVVSTVDLTQQEGISLLLEKMSSDPFCEMRINSVIKEKIVVPAGTKASLSFLDCPNEDVRLTATKAIDCRSSTSCPPTALAMPLLDFSLPVPLHSFTWNFTIPNNSTLDLVAPAGNLRQSLPGQECSQASSFRLTECDGTPIGDFCSSGTIQKIQVHANASITTPGRDLKRSIVPLLNVSVSKEISEGLIYTVIPDVSSVTTLVTPNWPNGMKKFSTVSWIVRVPDQYKALLKFVNVSRPKCSKLHANILVKMLGQEEELLSRQEGEEIQKELVVSNTFYLNMSNCKPETGHFSLLTDIVLQKKIPLLAIVLGLAGALLVLVIVLAVVCVLAKKKKKLKKENSAYITKGNIFRPSDRHFSKTRSENESHVYDSIDEFLVYGHLLDDHPYPDSLPSGKMQVDSYQTFTGATDGALPVIKEPDPEPETGQYKAFLAPSETFNPSRPHTPIQLQESLGFQDRRMVDNELYTFKSTGDIKAIRLSAVEPEASMSDEYL